MWMMGCKNGGGFSKCDSFHSRRLRPLIPRPTATPSSSSCLGCLHVDDFFALHSHLDQNKRELSATPASSRWNPTPEQLEMLEDLYQRGTRTPTAEQIQRITAMLRRYGKIEGKNVFYWFQNHKARERQKRRRQLESDTPNNVTKDNQVIEVEKSKNYASPTKCTAFAEESSPNQISTSNAGINSSKRIHPSLPLNLLQDSCSLELNLNHNESWYNDVSKQRNYEFDLNIEDFECGESKTLPLFPLYSSSMDMMVATPAVAPVCHSFFEFLPLKN